MISATHLHAMLIHFPIALLFVGFLSEIISLLSKKEFYKQVALYLLLLGIAGVIAAYLSGNNAGEGIENGPLKAPMELHEDAALVTLWLSFGTVIFYLVTHLYTFKDASIKWLRLLFFTILIGSSSYTGYLGGQLVYKHGAGVQLAMPDFNNTNPED